MRNLGLACPVQLLEHYISGPLSSSTLYLSLGCTHNDVLVDPLPRLGCDFLFILST